MFLGPQDRRIGEEIKTDLGVHGTCVPPVPVTEIPAWISHSDACAVPYRLNAFTQASHPLKGIEYLAMGAPVLSTRIPSLQHYDGVIEWVNEGDGESYARALDKLTNPSGNQERVRLRQQAVAEDSWGRRVNQFKRVVFNDRP